MLAFIKKAISLLATGVGFILLLEHHLLTRFGWLFILVWVFVQIWGLFRYFAVREILREELPADAMEN